MLKRIDKNYLLIIGLAILFVCFTIPQGHLFGSLVDWLPQHIMFPDYFRKLFYETGDLFPNFSLALGAGQNIFNFSYYGLLNPIVLVSYLLPFLDMTTYLIGANIILYILTGLLSYTWLKRHFSKGSSLLGTILLLCASPLLFHFHRHFMFVSYMPFVLLGLMGIENYFEKGKSSLLVISTFIIILMSYYYSIPSILVFILYGVYQYLKREKHITVKTFFLQGLRFVVPIIIGILMAGILLLPTLHTVLSGRGTGSEVSLLSLFVPNLTLKGVLYGHYGLGVTALSVLGLLYGFMHQKKEHKFLSIAIFIIIIFPLFSYVLNGTLYIRDKVFIPFLPLFILMGTNFIDHVIHKKIDKKIYIFALASSLWFFLMGCHNLMFYVDLLIVLLAIYIYSRKNISPIFLGVLVLVPVINLFVINHVDKYVEKSLYKDSIQIDKKLEEVLQNENDFVRTYHLDDGLYNVNKVYSDHYYKDSLYSSIYNNNYMDFYKNVFHNPQSYRNRLITSQNNNLLYQMFMGGKYMYSENDMTGYERVFKNTYINEDVLPVFYVTNHIVSEGDFGQMEYPYTVETLLKNVVVGDSSSNKVGTKVQKSNLKGHIKNAQNLDIQVQDDIYNINAKANNMLTYSLDPSLQGKILMLDFEIGKEWNCKDGDSIITINNISNTLTCKGWIYKNENKKFYYVIANKELKELNVKFAKGNYQVSSVHAYTLDYADIKNINEEATKVSVDMKRTQGDVIIGSVRADQDGYFVSSIPYDKGFSIYDNGRKIEYEKVNKSFVGFKINKGDHALKIVYKAPLMDIGKCMSLIGMIGFIILIFIEKKPNKNL